MEMCPWRTGSELGQASSDGFITSGYQSTAGSSQLVLCESDAIAGNTAVGIHSEAMIADPAHFGTEIAYTHFAGSALGQALTAL